MPSVLPSRHQPLRAVAVRCLALQFRQNQRRQEGIDVGTDFDLQLRVAHVGDVERLLVGLLDLGADEVHAPGDILGVGAVLRRVAGSNQGEQGDAGVADVGGILDLRPLDAATALDGGTPATSLAPAAIVVLLLDQVGQPLL